jgi:hypothetical protein
MIPLVIAVFYFCTFASGKPQRNRPANSAQITAVLARNHMIP